MPDVCEPSSVLLCLIINREDPLFKTTIIVINILYAVPYLHGKEASVSVCRTVVGLIDL